MSSSRPSHSELLLDSVQAALVEAVYLATSYDISELKHCHVQLSSNYRNSGDMKTNVAAALFLKHTAHIKVDTKNAVGENQKDEMKPPLNLGNVESESENVRVMEVTTTSRYGLEKPRRYMDVPSLAESIIGLIPEEAMQTLIAHAFVQSGPKNSHHIVIITKQHMDWQLNLDKLHCVTCGKFFKGSRGLRTHEIIDHKFATEDARQDALDSELQTTIPSSFEDMGDEGLNLVRKGDLDSIRELVNLKRWDPHTAVDKHGNTCLTWAAGEGHMNMCRFFVEECDMNPLVWTGARKRQRQALHWAARNGHIPICAWLIRKHGADVDIGTDDGSTPLHLAIWNNQPATVKWLVEKSYSDVNRKNSHGCNASQWAALSGDVDMLRYLRDKGLDLTILNSNGRSAVHKAGLKGHLEACKWLLTPVVDGGAGLSLSHVGPDIEGDTPASLARSNGHKNVEQWLLVEQSRLKKLSEKNI